MSSNLMLSLNGLHHLNLIINVGLFRGANLTEHTSLKPGNTGFVGNFQASKIAMLRKLYSELLSSKVQSRIRDQIKILVLSC